MSVVTSRPGGGKEKRKMKKRKAKQAEKLAALEASGSGPMSS